MPQEYTYIDNLEDIVRYWSKKAPLIRDWHWWDQMYTLGLSSVQGHQERYSIIYMWKIFTLLMTKVNRKVKLQILFAIQEEDCPPEKLLRFVQNKLNNHIVRLKYVEKCV